MGPLKVQEEPPRKTAEEMLAELTRDRTVEDEDAMRVILRTLWTTTKEETSCKS